MASDESSDLGALGDLAGYYLRRASGAFTADFTRMMAGTGIRQALFGIMSVVAANPGINQGSVGRSLGIQRANMVALINELAERGLMEREVDTADRRTFALTLSADGMALLDECLVRIREHEEGMLADLTPSERRMLIDLLGKIARRGR